MSLVDQLGDLEPEVIAGIGTVAAFLVVLAIGVQLSVRRMRRELRQAEEELVDRATGLLPRSALRVRLGAEIAWAATSGTPLAVAALRIRGSRFRHAAHALRRAMREEEGAFLLGDGRVAVELWGADPEAAALATRRLGEDLARAGHPVVDAGLGCSPRDGADVETLLAAAQRDLRPVDDPVPAGHDVGADGRARGPAARVARQLVGVAVPSLALAVLLLAAWRLLPAAIEPALAGAGTRSGADLGYALLAVIGFPLGAALLHAACWNRQGGSLPSSRPLARAGWRTGLVTALVVALPLAWGVFAPRQPAEFAEAFGAVLAVLALVLLVLVHARRFVHLPAPVLGLLLAAGAGVTWLAVEEWQMPVVADAGRLLAAAALGALLATLVERASWMFGLVVLAGAIDVWSVVSESGVSNRLLDGGSDHGDRVVDLLLFTGPVVEGVELFAVGTTDLVFLALFLTWAHDWRLDLRVVVGALLAASWVGVLVGELLEEAVPLLPFFGVAMVLVLVERSIRLRRRGRAWRRGDGADRIAA